MRLLVLAFDCNPILPSLPIVAYNTCKALAGRMEVSVVSYKQPEEFEIPGANETVFIDVDWLKAPVDGFAKLLRGGNAVGWGTKTAFTYPCYVLWEKLVWHRFKNRLGAGEFDLVFRVSPMSPVLPSAIAKKLPVPFVIGPLNGGLAFPKEIEGSRRSEREWLHNLRDLHRKLPYHQSTFDYADAILAGFSHTIEALPEAARERAICFPEVGFDPDRFYPSESPRDSTRTRFLFVGRLVANKCADILVRAFAAHPELREHQLTLVGSGPEEEAIAALIDEENLTDCVRLAGQLDQAEVARAMREADVFAFPSVRELGAGVVVEAMASALPPIVVDAGGPGSLVDATRGAKIQLAPKPDMVTGFADAMLEFAPAPGRISELGEAARRYAQRFRWDRKIDYLEEVFRWVLGEIPEKPHLYELDTDISPRGAKQQ